MKQSKKILIANRGVIAIRALRAARELGYSVASVYSTIDRDQKHLKLYRTWSEGEIGVLLTGNVQIDRNHLEGPANVCIEENTYKEQLPFLKKWAEEGTRNNTHLWMQVSHAGRQTPGEINTSPKAPSSVPLRIPGKKFGKPKALTSTEIKEIIKKFILI